MRILLACLAALLLAACAQTPKQSNPITARSASGPIIVGTLSLGPCEMSLAADYTRTKVALERATRRLNDGRLNVNQASRASEAGAGALNALDSVCQAERESRWDDARRGRDSAGLSIKVLEQLVGGGK